MENGRLLLRFKPSRRSACPLRDVLLIGSRRALDGFAAQAKAFFSEPVDDEAVGASERKA